MTSAPNINNSTANERRAFVQEQWKCLDHCPSCGKCSVLKGRDAEVLYSDYINGTRSYIDVSKEIRLR